MQINAAEVLKTCQSRKQDLLTFLEKIVMMESGSRDVDDVNALGDYLAGYAQQIGGSVLKGETTETGYPMSISFHCTPYDKTRRIVLGCHRDTVFPHGTTVKRPFQADANRCHGPGCADMKGGITIGLFAPQILQALGEPFNRIPIEIVISSDEEIGSPGSAGFIGHRCANAKAALFLEPARPDGSVVASRNGGSLFEIEVFGKAAHSGNQFLDGVSAINCLAEIIADLAKLSNDPEGYNLNVGLISGGSGVYIVPDYARAAISTRFTTLQQRDFLLQSCRSIIESHEKPGIKITMSKPVGFLPMDKTPANQALLDLVRKAAGKLNLSLTSSDVRGPADCGIASCMGIPTLCGMGPVGGNLHTALEYLDTESLVERLALLCLSLIEIDSHYQ